LTRTPPTAPLQPPSARLLKRFKDPTNNPRTAPRVTLRVLGLIQPPEYDLSMTTFNNSFTARRTLAATAFSASTLSAALFAAFSAGCVDNNDRLSVGNTLIVEGIAPPKEIDLDEAITAKPRADDGPSVVALDRQNWSTTDFVVPYDGTRHRPQYTSTLRFTDRTARQRNEYPTLSSALDLNGDEYGDDSWWNRLGEAAVMPFFAASEGILMVPRLVGEPQWFEVWSPTEAYERSPAWGPRSHDRIKPPFRSPAKIAAQAAKDAREIEAANTEEGKLKRLREDPATRDRPETSGDPTSSPRASKSPANST